ncbi:1889_t:CDS:2 [Ambispora gerdemannii]|uniref:1889_t:CDS:1 n=1 Tax=Ambispora gerdemannii TaxID=144530 RepID=A0A9N8VTL5_9GLOM|nr:1889_t:CDS:2 [Ambispora gerdemannii]
MCNDGLAGAGKTFYVEGIFEPTKDAYISPMVDVQTEKALKAKHGNHTKLSLKTFEKLDEVKVSPDGVLYIDEAGAFNKQYLIFIMLKFSAKKFVFLGDDEQTKYFDPVGDLGNEDFCSLIHYRDITVMYYSFRYGPTVAAHLNTAFNYPVFSLRNEDMKLYYHNLDEFGTTVEGVNLTVTEKSVTHFKERNVNNVRTVKSSQGQNCSRVNLLYFPRDVDAAIQYHSNGIVGASRARDKLHIYLELKSKSSKHTKNLTAMVDNYSTMFDVVVPNTSDF